MKHMHLTADQYPLHMRIGITVQEVADDGSRDTEFLGAVVIPHVSEGLWEEHWTVWAQEVLKQGMLAISRNSATGQ